MLGPAIVREAGIMQTSVVQAPLERSVEALIDHKVCRAQGALDADHFPYGLAFIVVCLASVRAGSVAGRLHTF